MDKNRFRFRAWDGHLNQMYNDVDFTKKYCYVKISDRIPEGEVIKVEHIDWAEIPLQLHAIPIEQVILMQCTGLKDKNGRLIYEGDVLKIQDELHLVEWKVFRAGGIFVGMQTLEHDDRVEVVGNIYQDSYLMEKPEQIGKAMAEAEAKLEKNLIQFHFSDGCIKDEPGE